MPRAAAPEEIAFGFCLPGAEMMLPASLHSVPYTVLSGYSHRSAIRHAPHFGCRAVQV